MHNRLNFKSLSTRLLLVLAFALLAFGAVAYIGSYYDQLKDRGHEARLFYLEAESEFSQFSTRVERARIWKETLEDGDWQGYACASPPPFNASDRLDVVLLTPEGAIACQNDFSPKLDDLRKFAELALAPNVARQALGTSGNHAFLAFRVQYGEGEGILAVDLGVLPRPYAGAQRILVLGLSGLLYDSDGTNDMRLSSPAPVLERLSPEHHIAFVRLEETGAMLVAVGRKEHLFSAFVEAAIVPVMLYVLALVTAYLGADFLIGGYLRDLPHRIRRFGETRSYMRGRHVPRVDELVQAEGEFIRLIKRVNDRDSALEKDLGERKFLLKELNHRVHNNLQTISSLMSISIRRAKSEHEKKNLAALQDKVLTLAATHRALFQGDAKGFISTNILLREIVGQRIDIIDSVVGANFSMEIDNLSIVADQAVPFALFAVEAISRAFAFAEDLGNAFGVRLYFYRSGEDQVTLLVENTSMLEKNTREEHDEKIGRGLLQAYAAQLGGRIEVTQSKTCFALRPDQFKTAERGGFWQVFLVFRLDDEIRTQVDF